MVGETRTNLYLAQGPRLSMPGRCSWSRLFDLCDAVADVQIGFCAAPRNSAVASAASLATKPPYLSMDSSRILAWSTRTALVVVELILTRSG